MPCIACGSSFQVLHKSADSVASVFCSFPGLSGPGSQRLGRTLPRCGAPVRCLRLTSVQRAWPLAPTLPVAESQEVFRQTPGPVCSVGGGGFSGAEFAPFPSPLPPTSSGDGPALLWSFSVPLFCERLAVCSGRLIFPCYPTV